MLALLVLSKHNYLNYKNKQYKSCSLKLVKYQLQKILNIVKCTECSRSLEFEKRTDQNFITQNLPHGKEYCISKKKILLKQSQKEVMYEYILVFAGWWSIFWKVVGSGGSIWLVVGGGGYIWLVVGGDGWWWVVRGGGIV